LSGAVMDTDGTASGPARTGEGQGAASAKPGQRLRKLRRQLEAVEAERDRLGTELRAAREKLGEQRQRIQRMDAAAAERLKELDSLGQQLTEARGKLELMQASRSWRVTRPLRGGRAVLRKLSPRRTRT
jgi:chromosome segregation ATPase